jgi:hypothetical protein
MYYYNTTRLDISCLNNVSKRMALESMLMFSTSLHCYGFHFCFTYASRVSDRGALLIKCTVTYV